MNKRKFFGTILGLIFWSFCVVFFTYAYYDWKSVPTNVVLGIEDLSVECLVGANVSATNIGPVLNYQDGVKAEFSIENPMIDNMAIELRLDIISISDNLLTDSLKYVLVADSTGGTNYDYNNPVRTGDFSKFNVGNNIITKALEVSSEITTNYQFIIYIDGNMYNNPNIQENSLTANLMIGNCGENAVPMNEMAYQAIYSETDKSLTFIYNKKLKEGDTYNDKQVTKVYTGFETANYYKGTEVPWREIRENIEIVNFEEFIKPKSTAYWFRNFNNLTSINLEKLDTFKVTSMYSMFYGCSSLKELDLSNFNTSNVANMAYMFTNCTSLINLDLSSFNTSNVTSMLGMFSDCQSLLELELDLSNFDTKNVTDMSNMFYNCRSLTTLDLCEWDTSKVTDMAMMFQNCFRLTATITIRNATLSNYSGIFVNTSIGNEAQLTVNYTSETSSLVDNMIATKSSNSNVVKGSCIGDNCLV